MHSAPAVGFQTGRSRLHLGAVVLVLLSGLLTSITFAVNQPPLGSAFVFACLVISSGVAILAWINSPQGLLQWDGQHWSWSVAGDPQPCSLRLVLDFQTVLLVGVKTDARQLVWLWLEPKSADSKWTALRRAVIARQVHGGRKPVPNSLLGVGDPA
jgi:hypothetical protein